MSKSAVHAVRTEPAPITVLDTEDTPDRRQWLTEDEVEASGYLRIVMGYIARLQPNTADTRSALYERARKVVAMRLIKSDPPVTLARKVLMERSLRSSRGKAALRAWSA